MRLLTRAYWGELLRDNIDKERNFLPDYCTLKMFLVVTSVAFLAVVVIALARARYSAHPWLDFVTLLLVAQACAIFSNFLLCKIQTYTVHWKPLHSFAASYVGIIVGTAIISEIAYWLARAVEIETLLGDYSHAGMVLRSIATAALLGLIVQRYLYMRYQWKYNLYRETEARMEALQAQIHPHFLFNTLNMIAELTRTDPEAAEGAVENLAQMYRSRLAKSENRVTLAEEISLGKGYLSIENFRLGDRLRVEWDIDNLPTDAKLPGLVLQPLLENAVYHGIEPAARGGVIQVKGVFENNAISIIVINPVATNAHRKHKGNQIAQNNIIHRLKLAFGKHAYLNIEKLSDQYRVTLHFPYQKHAGGASA